MRARRASSHFERSPFADSTSDQAHRPRSWFTRRGEKHLGCFWNVMNFVGLFRSQERFQFVSPNVRAILFFPVLKRIQVNERIGKSVLEKTIALLSLPFSLSLCQRTIRGTKRSIIRANRRKLEWNEGTIGAICNNELSSIGYRSNR